MVRDAERIVEVAERLRGVQVENRMATDVISRFNHERVLIYADPPYLPETRNRKQYFCEMDYEEHEELLNLLLKHAGPALISGYDSDLYTQKLNHWHREEIISYAMNSGKRKEVLWMNFEPYGRQLGLEEMRW